MQLSTYVVCTMTTYIQMYNNLLSNTNLYMYSVTLFCTMQQFMSITTLNYIDTLYQLVSIDLCRESITTSICYALQKIITTYVETVYQLM